MNSELFKNKLGIIGAGNIGLSLILKLLKKGYPEENIKLTYRGTIFTFEKLYDNNLVDMISDNARIVEESDIIILSVPPQAFKQIGDFGITDDKLVISFMAGISIDEIKQQTGSNNIIRIIPTGPDTIMDSSSIAGAYPSNQLAEEFFKLWDMDYYIVDDEDKMDLMVLAGCLPAVYCKVDADSKENIDAIRKIAGDCTEFIELSQKAKNLVPKDNKEEFIEKFSTPGGITAAIIRSLDDGNDLYDSLLKGLERNKEVSNPENNLISPEVVAQLIKK